jgi:hypothetical protein
MLSYEEGVVKLCDDGAGECRDGCLIAVVGWG